MKYRYALRVAGYNRRLYVLAGLALGVALVVQGLPWVPPMVKVAAGLGGLLAGWFAASSFLAFHWMFDRSGLLGGQWLTGLLAGPPRRWVQVNAGLEETTIAVQETFPGTEGVHVDIFDPAIMTEPALTRARQNLPSAAKGLGVIPDHWADCVVVTLAAHEIRSRSRREAFFRELSRIVAEDGCVVLVEHLRDMAALLAFGPGLFHFMPRSEWLRLGPLAGLELAHESRITPFVAVFVYRPSSWRPEMTA